MKLRAKDLIYAQLYIVLCIGVLVSEFHLPSAVKYSTDIVCLITFFMCLSSIPKIIQRAKMLLPTILALILLAYCILNAILNGTPLILVLWAVRVSFRFIAFFLCCIVALERKDLPKIINIIEKAYIINFIVILFQYFVQGYNQDYLGGIFGIEQGCNGQLNLFIVLVLSLQVIKYFEKKTNLYVLPLFITFAFIIAALSELKVVYLEIVIILLLAVCLYKPSWKMFITVGIFSLGLIVGMITLKNVFPKSYDFFFDQEEMENYLSASWIKGVQVTRTTGFDVINNYFFQNDVLKKIIGLGFGKCEVSTFFSSDFADRYSNTSYRQFTFAMQYLETGAVGLMLYIFFFISILLKSATLKLSAGYSYLKKYLSILVPLIIINIWYNDSCKTEVAYLLFCLLSFVGVVTKEEKNDT